MSLSRLFHLFLFGCQGLVLISTSLWTGYQFWLNRWGAEDAYISFRYARNLVEGNGLVYNPGEKVEGYTNFLWTLLSAIPLMGGEVDPLPFLHVVGLALWSGTILVFLWLGWRFLKNEHWIAPLIGLPLLFHPPFGDWFFSGMETPLFTFLILSVVSVFTMESKYRLFASAWFSVILLLVRPDGWILVVTLICTEILLRWNLIGFLIGHSNWRGEIPFRTHPFRNPGEKWKDLWYSVILPIVPLVLVWLPYSLWRLNYYGCWLPNTYYAKAAYLSAYSRGWEYLSTYFVNYPIGWFLVLLPVGCVLTKERSLRQFLWVTLLFTIGWIYYLLRIGGDWMEWRFIMPWLVLLVPALVLSASSIGRFFIPEPRPYPYSFSAWLKNGLGLLSGFLLIFLLYRGLSPSTSLTIPHQDTVPVLKSFLDPEKYNWRAIGKTLNEVLPPDVKIATTSAGTIPYFANRPCLDLCGLTDMEIGKQILTEETRGWLGHDHWLRDFEVMRTRGVDAYIYWGDLAPYPRSLEQIPNPRGEMVSIRIPLDGRFFEILILNPASFDTPSFRNHPAIVASRGAGIPSKSRYASFRLDSPPMLEFARIDLGDPQSENRHGIDQSELQEVIHSFRKYESFPETHPIEDEGRPISDKIAFHFDMGNPYWDLTLLVRYSTRKATSFLVRVNGQTLTEQLRLNRATDSLWNEAYLVIPKHLLLADKNWIELTPEKGLEKEAQIYHLWLLAERI